MENYCLTCLSNDRRLHQITNNMSSILCTLLPMFGQETRILLCWECHSVLRNVKVFCDRAVNSKNIMETYLDTRDADDIPSTRSDLRLSKTCITSLTPNDSIDLGKNQSDSSLSVSSHIDNIPRQEHAKELLKDKDGDKLKNIKRDTSKEVNEEILNNEKEVKNSGTLKSGNETLKGRIKCKMKSKDGNKTSYRCKICSKMFNTRGAYEYHKERHEARPQCEECGKTFVSKSVLWTHRNLVHKDTKKYLCRVCKKVFFTESGYQSHVATHQDGRDIYYCQPCGKFFKTNSSYRKHQRRSVRHSDPETWKHACTECERRFQTEEKAKDHYDMMHLNIRRFKCTQCARQYCTERGLKQHVKIKHDLVEQPKNNVCHVCGKSFKSSQVLAWHVRAHAGARPLACAACAARFSQPAGLRAHRRRACARHSNTQAVSSGLE